jgi:hypothetical protein
MQNSCTHELAYWSRVLVALEVCLFIILLRDWKYSLYPWCRCRFGVSLCPLFLSTYPNSDAIFIFVPHHVYSSFVVSIFLIIGSLSALISQSSTIMLRVDQLLNVLCHWE